MMIRGHNVETKQHPLISLSIALALVCGSVSIGLADATNSGATDSSISVPPNLGSVDDYVKNREYPYPGSALPSYVPLLGISVFRNEGKLASGQRLSGLAVTSVDKSSPAYDAGIRAQRLKKTKVAAQIGAAALCVGASVFFPPAVIGIPLLARNMGSPRAYDVIVAIDAERIRDVNELENSLRYVKAGETIYVTIIREGQRVQLRVPMPAVVSAPTPLLPQ
jgi:S1-C subfamily serine protease